MAARFWIGGGTNTNWNASPTTNWAATSGGTTRVAAPGATDDVTFDGVGVNANTVSIISAGTTVLSFSVTGGYTSTMTFTGSLTVAGTITLGANMTIAGAGTLTSSAAGTLTSTGKTWPNAFTVSTAGATRTFADAWTIGGTLTFSITATITLSGLLTVNGTMSILNGVVLTFAGAFGWTIQTFLSNHSSAATLTLVNGITYIITISFNASASRIGSIFLITSDHATNKAILTLNNGASCNVFASFTRIDASAGRPIYSFNGTITTCLNIYSFTDALTPAVQNIIKAGAIY